MKNIKIEVTVEELLLLTTLMADQLFRREFIDPKMPGYKGDPAELAMGKELVGCDHFVPVPGRKRDVERPAFRIDGGVELG